jgi:hypothetical protein
MDVQKFLGAAFLKVGDVKTNGPITVTIVDVSEGEYEKLDASFDDGTRLSLNVTNSRVLARAYGINSDDWVGKQIELVVSEIQFKGKPKEAILVKPISPPVEKKPPPSKKMGDGELNDEIPF